MVSLLLSKLPRKQTSLDSLFRRFQPSIGEDREQVLNASQNRAFDAAVRSFSKRRLRYL